MFLIDQTTKTETQTNGMLYACNAVAGLGWFFFFLVFGLLDTLVARRVYVC